MCTGAYDPGVYEYSGHCVHVHALYMYIYTVFIYSLHYNYYMYSTPL